MAPMTDESRRRLLRHIALGMVLIPVSSLGAKAVFADAPMVTPDDPTAKALKYVEDAGKASGAKPGSQCANCMFYQGAANSAQGPCTVFSGKQVKAAGWCSSWAAKT